MESLQMCFKILVSHKRYLEKLVFLMLSPIIGHLIAGSFAKTMNHYWLHCVNYYGFIFCLKLWPIPLLMLYVCKLWITILYIPSEISGNNLHPHPTSDGQSMFLVLYSVLNKKKALPIRKVGMKLFSLWYLNLPQKCPTQN